MSPIERIKELVELLNHYRDEYYNNHNSEISDFEYDQLFDELSTLERETGFIMTTSPTQTVGYEVKSELVKVKHNHPMLSLDKTKNIYDVLKFIGDEPFVAMAKMDGLTCSIRYLNGRIVSAETRGNGEIGESVLHNIITVKNLPLQIDYKDELIVDGEIIVADEDFNKINDSLSDDEKYKNSRNLASGSIRQLDSKIAAQRNMRFIAWKCITPINVQNAYNNNFAWRLNYLKTLGFEVVYCFMERIKNLAALPQYKAVDNAVVLQDIVNLIVEWAKERGYKIDGCVFGYNNIAYGDSLGATSHHLRSQYAYKFYNELYETKLVDIEWSMGKTGMLTPTAIFQTVQIDGCDISKASLHNVSIIKKLGLTNNCTVYISKRNEIIPQVEECLQDGDSPIKTPTLCPICGHALDIVKENESEVLMCQNPTCSGKVLGQFKFFVSKTALDVEDLSEKTLEFCINMGWLENFKDIYTLYKSRDEWVTYSGFGEKSVDNILESIEKSRNTTLDRFICALSIDGVGKSASKTLAEAFNGDFDRFIEGFQSGFDWTILTDIGDKTAQNINEYLVKNEAEIRELAREFNFVAPTKIETKDNPFIGKSICCTGKLTHFTRDSINAKITELGAKVANSVSKTTDFLLTNEASGSSKYNKAVQLNIPIINETTFLSMINENI